MLAGIYTDNETVRSMNSGLGNINGSIEPLYTLDNTQESKEKFKIKIKKITDDDSSYPIRSKTEL